MGYRAPDTAHLILLDRHGAVRWRHSGAFDGDANMDYSAKVSGLLHEP